MRAYDDNTSLTTKQPSSVNADFARELITGLSQPQKRIPSRFFYDARGSDLFEKITTLREYYPTRVERNILENQGDAIAAAVAHVRTCVEFGSGSSKKTEVLLERLDKLSAYVPIDVSADALRDAAARLGKKFPKLKILPVVGDFSKSIDLPDIAREGSRVGFFPGSTIGNFMPEQAIQLLRAMARTLGTQSELIVGYDLKKSEAVLNTAYNDAEGVTAAFNLNVLAHANRALATNFDLHAFSHFAAFDPETGGVDMYLVSDRDQSVSLQDRKFHFKKGERIHTEHSHKYSNAEFARIAKAADWEVAQTWNDPHDMMAVAHLKS